MLYRVAAGTGFRASEMRSLTPASFDLDADPPTVAVEAAYSKRRGHDVQPTPKPLAIVLQPWLARKAKRAPVFDLPQRTAEMLRADLAAAGIASRDEAGHVVDFHSPRHTYVSHIVEGGASVKVAQELARHSTPTLTIGRYAKTRLHDLTAALEGLPIGDPTKTEAATLRATGTDDDVQRLVQRAVGESGQPNAAMCDDDAAHSDDDDAKRLRFATLRDDMRSEATMPPPGLEPGTRGLRVRCSAS